MPRRWAEIDVGRTPELFLLAINVDYFGLGLRLIFYSSNRYLFYPGAKMEQEFFADIAYP